MIIVVFWRNVQCNNTCTSNDPLWYLRLHVKEHLTISIMNGNFTFEVTNTWNLPGTHTVFDGFFANKLHGGWIKQICGGNISRPNYVSTEPSRNNFSFCAIKPSFGSCIYNLMNEVGEDTGAVRWIEYLIKVDQIRHKTNLVGLSHTPATCTCTWLMISIRGRVI